MGQRHQIFVKIANPAKHIYTRNDAEKRHLKKSLVLMNLPCLLTITNGCLVEVLYKTL